MILLKEIIKICIFIKIMYMSRFKDQIYRIIRKKLFFRKIFLYIILNNFLLLY